VVNDTDLDAALRYYKIYRVMYLLAVSDGPYLTSKNQVSTTNNWFYYEFREPFVLQFAYGDLSWDPELDIIAIFVDLGPSMIFTGKQLYKTNSNEQMLRITTWAYPIPGNYTILVNLTNAALVERTFFINIIIPNPFVKPEQPIIKNETDFLTGLYIGSHTRLLGV